MEIDEVVKKPRPVLPDLLGIVSHAVLDDRSHALIGDWAKRKKNTKSISDDYTDDKESIRRRLDTSDRAISELLRDGYELIQDIQVANDKREVGRRIKEAEIREELLEKLQAESDEAIAKFESISEKWIELKNLKDPMTINDDLQLQKKRIQDLMKQKDIIIGECRKELRAADERYSRDLYKQTADIHSLVERVDSQIEIMKRAFKEHLELLENTIDEERHILRLAASKKWDDLYTRRAVNERIKLKQERDRLDFYRKKIEHIEQEHIEVTRATRIRLEQDNQALEIELQKVKTSTTLNAEKLDYNFQVLKKREDENLMVRNAQKRRLTKLNETIFVLRRKIKDVRMNYLIETEKITSDIAKLRSSIIHMTTKVNTFADINDKKYNFVWLMNQQECSDVLKSILSIDNILVEQHLGQKWKTISITDDGSLVSSTINSEKVPDPPRRSSTLLSDVSEREQTIEILKDVLQQAGFLFDKSITKLIEHYTEDEKNVVHIDNVLSALGVLNWDDVHKLKSKFEEARQSRFRIISESSTKQSKVVLSKTEQEDETEDETSIIESDVSSFLVSSENLRTLKSFSQELISNGMVSSTNKCGGGSDKVSTKHVKDYWTNFRNMFPPDRVRVWETMETNLVQYLKIAARDSWWMIIQTTGIRTHIGAVFTKHQSVPF
ncbi:dynein regulatory complex protein 1 homolog isoform X3 [Toxorhynchites rutilus septentrionalis]|uniref:dynein regulatory complex protein 1 homolog isoform X3 n=1 Tax=Toxorhynchites rutilus septentrionalis TaxID=329112 RepID=UPI002479D39F|nr:dynein regulatory complex protein 1 homolog isoform X3 [Toxorhynchites rutilus septentrionalis]